MFGRRQCCCNVGSNRLIVHCGEYLQENGEQPRFDLQPLLSALEASSTEAQSLQIAKYMKTEKPVYGVKVPLLRSLVREYASQQREIFSPWDAEKSRSLAKCLWQTENWSLQQAAIEVLEYDLKWHKKEASKLETLKFCEGLIMPGLDGWAQTDLLATKVLPYLVPNAQHLLGWLDSKSFWIRRCSLLAQFPQMRKQQADLQVYLQCVDALLEDSEWFIQKAIGWSLRECGKKEAEWVLSVVEQRPKMSKLARKEALRNLV